MRFLFRMGMARGWFGSSRIFTTLSVVVALVRFLQKTAGTAPKTVYTHKLEKGQVLVIQDGESQPR